MIRTRREFLREIGGLCAFCAAAGLVEELLAAISRSSGSADGATIAAGDAAPAQDLAELIRTSPVARYWVSTLTASTRDDCLACHDASALAPGGAKAPPRYDHGDRRVVKCLLCARRCTIEDGERGLCRARINVHGELRSLVYGRPIAIHVDPIEKKPFYHFVPGSQAFSMATSGCPLRCKFCQNWEISQASPEDYAVETTQPAEIVRAAVARDAPIIAFTYNEPTVFTEYLTDIARAARGSRVRSVLVSCGFMNEAPLAEMCSTLAAIKIDLKGFDERFYHEVSGVELAPVLRSVKQVARSGVHLELVNLVVPTLNDSEPMLTGLADWVAGEIGPDVPVHFTRFHPDYQLQNLPPTPVETLERARNIALARGLHYVYVGNVPGHPGNHTYCPACGKMVIQRDGFFVTRMDVVGGQCRWCKAKIAGVWQ